MDKNNFRAAILAFYLRQKPPVEIAKLLGVGRKTVHRIINRYIATGTTNDWTRCGRPKTVDTPKLRAVIKKRITRNRQKSMKHAAKELNVNRESVRRIITKTFGLYPYKLLRAQLLNDRQKLGRLEKCKAMLKRFRNGKHRRSNTTITTTTLSFCLKDRTKIRIVHR